MTDRKQLFAIILFLGVPLIYNLFPKSFVEPYEDGIYCAEIECYDPRTKKEDDFTLPVEIEDFRLIKIHWKNDEFIYDIPFQPEDISDGECELNLEGRVYKIKLKDFGKCD